ncbi:MULTISPECIES: SDR family oxidoreductase [Rhodococcus]|uniref:SDR family oxidoreductase n=1 Tax=Rhodococcus TaxID=1827 RepID=UPI001226DF89|nr:MULTISPECIES: SDR family NAD(P)-dependent oxidoreductase [Rhodococcus]QXW05202.1 SDR family oxidoreductase [Rhodococcus globerulus]RZL20932.1 MAG: SDR family oxidoreductase [Rhodococcus sp. (in: high G+C Gram-positive bacteria)]
MTVSGRVAVVSGGAAGIGLAIAQRLADDGFKIAVLDVVDGAAEAAADAITAAGGEAKGYRADVANREQVDIAVEAARAHLGPIAVVVANAAIARQQEFLGMTLEQWNHTLGVNLTGTFNVVQTCLPDLVEAGWGRVVLISSSSAQRGAPRMAHYAASKGGQIALTKALAVEFAKSGVTVNTVAPSSIDTPSVQKKREEGTIPSAEDMAKYIPVGREGTGQDIANAVSYLVSEGASYVTGQTLSVNGGSFIG